MAQREQETLQAATAAQKDAAAAQKDAAVAQKKHHRAQPLHDLISQVQTTSGKSKASASATTLG